MKKLAAFLSLSLLVLPMTGSAKEEPAKERSLSAPRIRLGDIVDVPEELRALDLGPSPLPGSSRTINKEELLLAIPEEQRQLVSLPRAVRVVRKSQTLSVPQIETLCTDALEDVGLPRGATLTKVRPRGAAKVAEGFDAVRVAFPKPPRREGKHTTAATVILTQEGDEVGRLTVSLELMLSKEAAIPDVAKGTKVQLVVRRGAVAVSALSTVLTDADIGETTMVKVTESGKVIRATITGKDSAAEVP